MDVLLREIMLPEVHAFCT